MALFYQLFSDYYYLVLILQGICVFHSIRKGNQSKWIWIIVFLPLLGSLAYLFTEVIKKRDVDTIQSGVVKLVNPSGRIKELEKNFKFSDTFANRTALADAYLDNGEYNKAIDLYEPALNGLFSNNEHVIKQLITAYYQTQRFGDVVKIAPRIEKGMYFSKSTACLLYALSLEKMDKMPEAEKQYLSMNHRFSNYEARYHYGRFLIETGRKEDAALIWHEIVDEAQHLNRKEKGDAKVWIDKATLEWKKLMA